MFKSYSEKTKTGVSTVIFMTVLTFVLSACNKYSDNNSSSVITENAEKIQAIENAQTEKASSETVKEEALQDGEYKLYVSLTGGSGRASITSPTTATVNSDQITLKVEWSSSNYDYMIVDNTKYLPVNDDGNSLFEIPVSSLDGEISVIADTVAMGNPHEIEYVIAFSQNSPVEDTDDDTDESTSKTSNKEIVNTKIKDEDIHDWQNHHTVTGKLERVYAERFGIAYYDEKYCMVVINDSDYYMLNGNGFSIPEDMPNGITVINVPLSDIDLVSKSTVDYFSCLDILNCVSFSSIKKNESENEKVTELMNQEKIKYAGKYSAPDYEMLLSDGCSLVVENTMITHTPDVLEQLHNIGISTLIDYSSHEPSPIGRMEWIKLYGLLGGKLEEAEKIFNEKSDNLSNRFAKNEKKTAYFYVSENGGIGIRKNQDYIVKLIDIAGGKYAFEGHDEYDGTGQMTIQKEAFYAGILDCDVLIYNSTINGGITSKDELVSKCEVLRNTNAFKNDQIYCTRDNIYLSVMNLPEITDELNSVLCDKEVSEYFYKLK